MTAVRVRGIYATALTRLLDAAGLDVVQASPPIRRRFDADFEISEHDVAVETSGDRLGIEVSGTSAGVDDVSAAVADLAPDVLSWRTRAARGAVFDAVVDRDAGGGAVLTLDDDLEGYLPYDDADGYVSEGDRLRVQVHDPVPPWADGRPVVSTGIRAAGGVATLVRGVDSLVADTPDGTAEHELVRTTELLSTDVPEGWAVAWERPAEDAEIAALDDAVADAVARAAPLTDPLADAPDPAAGAPRRVVAPDDTVWTWFGRDARFALDAVRREVATTMPGHHRIKAGSRAASTAVDFAERLQASDAGHVDATWAGSGAADFPFEAVTGQFGPTEGDRVAIEHGKPDGRLLTLGRGEVTDRDVEAGRITVRREMTAGGTYDELGVEREAGDVAITRFTEGQRWYPTVYRDEAGAVKGTYLNVSTPVELFPNAVRYVDLHVDVVKHADGTVTVVDRDELQESVDAGHVSEELAADAIDVAERVERAVGGD